MKNEKIAETTDSLYHYLCGVGRANPEKLQEIFAYPHWQQHAQEELDRRITEIIGTLDLETLSKISTGQVDVQAIAKRVIDEQKSLPIIHNGPEIRPTVNYLTIPPEKNNCENRPIQLINLAKEAFMYPSTNTRKEIDMNAKNSKNNAKILVDRLQDIHEKMVDLLNETRGLLKRSDYQEIFFNADATWIKQIKTALYTEDDDMEASGNTFEETVDKLLDDAGYND